MSLKVFYTAIFSMLLTVIALSLTWEFWLEDLLLPSLISDHETETSAHRWEFVITTAVFAFIALIGPTVIGTQIIRRDRDLQQAVVRLPQEDDLTGLFNRRRTAEMLRYLNARTTEFETSGRRPCWKAS